MVKKLLIAATLLCPLPALAEPISPVTAQCLVDVSNQSGIHTDVLLAILMVEGGTVGKDNNGNTNGTYDIGPFQINSMHLPRLKHMGISETKLRNNGCVNATVAAVILRESIPDNVMASIKTPEDYLRAIARYHSKTPKYNERYAKLLHTAFERLYASTGVN